MDDSELYDESASESDESASESDESASDSDESASDSDESASDSDESASDSDESASDSDGWPGLRGRPVGLPERWVDEDGEVRLSSNDPF